MIIHLHRLSFKPLKRDMRKRRFRNAPGIFLVVLLIGLLGYLLGWSKFLEIRTIEITAAGNESIVTPLIVPKDLHVGLPMARLSTQRISHDLATLTWINKIRINRRWLAHDVRITVTERRAVARYVDSDGVIEYFDPGGHNFTAPNPPSGIPTIDFGSQSASSRSAVATFLAQTPNDLTAKMSSLSVDEQNQITLTTALPGYRELTIAWGGVDQLSLKVKVLRQLLTLPENKKIVNVDLTNPLTPVVK